MRSMSLACTSKMHRTRARTWVPAIAGLLLLLAYLHTAAAAHEPEPVPLVKDGTPKNPAPQQPQKQPPQQQKQKDQQQNQKQQQQKQQKQQQQKQQKDPPPAAVSPPSPEAMAVKRSPSPAPAPYQATMLPLMPMVLPACPHEDILNSNKPWDFPQKWGSMNVEQQALHPINLLFMNMVGVPSTDLMGMVNPCLYSWGVVKGSVSKIVKDYKVGNSMTMKTVVLVFRTKKDVFVVFRPTDDDWVADFDCMYTDDLRKTLHVPVPLLGGKKLQLHRGFWAAYQAVDKPLMSEINKQMMLLKASNPFNKPSVWMVGHSLGGALVSILAFKMVHDPWFSGEIGGVVTYGSPRVGNEEWQQLYHSKLLPLTLRWNNYRDLFAALPAKGQFCLSGSPLRTVFSFRHVGKAVLMCPAPNNPGLQQFKFFPKGTETVCNTGENLSINTHLLGHYFDGWRRAYALKYGLSAATVLSGGPHVRAVMCSQCATAVKPYPLPDNKAARNDGVVSCVDTSSCNNKTLFGIVSWAGLFPTAFFRSDAVCDPITNLCQVPSAALTQVQTKLLQLAPNFTSAVTNLAYKSLQHSAVGQILGLFSATGPTGLGNLTSFYNFANNNGSGLQDFADRSSTEEQKLADASPAAAGGSEQDQTSSGEGSDSDGANEPTATVASAETDTNGLPSSHGVSALRLGAVQQVAATSNTTNSSSSHADGAIPGTATVTTAPEDSSNGSSSIPATGSGTTAGRVAAPDAPSDTKAGRGFFGVLGGLMNGIFNRKKGGAGNALQQQQQ